MEHFYNTTEMVEIVKLIHKVVIIMMGHRLVQ